MEIALPEHLCEQVWDNVRPDVLLGVALSPEGNNVVRNYAMRVTKDLGRNNLISPTEEDADAIEFAGTKVGVFVAKASLSWFMQHRVSSELTSPRIAFNRALKLGGHITTIIPVGPDLCAALEPSNSFMRHMLGEDAKQQIRQGVIPRSMMLGDVRVLPGQGPAPHTVVLVRSPIWGCGNEIVRTMNAYRSALEHARIKVPNTTTVTTPRGGDPPLLPTLNSNKILVLGIIGEETCGPRDGSLETMAREAMRVFVLAHTAFLAGVESTTGQQLTNGWTHAGPRFSHVLFGSTRI
jgi:hypothetical protein